MLSKHQPATQLLLFFLSLLCFSFSGCSQEARTPPSSRKTNHPNQHDSAVVEPVKTERSTVESLIATLEDKDSRIRNSAAEKLGKIGDKRAVEPLIIALTDASWEVNQSATEALTKIGAPAVEPLIAALNDKEWRVRYYAAEALGKIGDQRAMEPLIITLKKENEKRDVRKSAAKALKVMKAFSKTDENHVWYLISQGNWNECVQLGDVAVGPLITTLKDESWYVRKAAAETLGKIGDQRAVEPLIATLQNEKFNNNVRKAVTKALIKIGAPAVEPLIVALKKKEWNVTTFITEALGEIGTPAVKPLIATLKDEDKWVRAFVAETLGKIGDQRAVEPLIATLQDEDSNVRQSTVNALSKIGDKQVIEPLLTMLKDEDSNVRQSTVNALSKIGDPRAVEPLIATLKDEDSNVRQSTVNALSKIGDKRVVEPLLTMLKDKDNDVRSSAIEGLDKIGDKRAVEPLTGMLTDRHCCVVAAKSLQKMNWQPQTKEERIHFLVGLDDSAIKKAENWQDIKTVLMQDIKSGDDKKLAYALKTFTHIGNEAILSDLLQLIETRGTVTIAQAYLNCNHTKLQGAARAWAKSHGYSIFPMSNGVETWNWGQ